MLLVRLLWTAMWSVVAVVLAGGSFLLAIWMFSEHGGWAGLATWVGGVVVASLCWGLAGIDMEGRRHKYR